MKNSKKNILFSVFLKNVSIYIKILRKIIIKDDHEIELITKY